MTTTPEQLQAWREKFEKAENPYHTDRQPNGVYTLNAIENRWKGYLRRCQETEQAVKDAKHFKEILDVAYNRFELKQTDKDFLFSFGIFEAPNIEVKEQELLK